MQNSVARAVSAIAAVLLVAGIGAASAEPAFAGNDTNVRAGVDDFTFSNFTADYYLGRDASGHSTLRTVEKLTAQFPSSDQNKGIVRKIPDDYLGASLHTTFVSVSDTNGLTKPYSVSDDGDYTTVETGTDDYVHGAVTYTLTYTQTNVVGSFSNTHDQEFYWDTNGTQWTQPFSRVTALVHVPADLGSALTSHDACYQGAQGSTQKCDIAPPSTGSDAPASPEPGQTSVPTFTPTAGVFTATATHLAAGENMSVAIGFAKGTFAGAPHASAAHSTPAKDTVWGEVVGGILLFIGIAAIPFALIRRFAFGQRNAKGRGTIIAQYDIPTGMNLMEAGTIVKKTGTEIAAQIVSFAVRGNLRILDYPITTSSGADYTLEFLNATGLDAEETSLITSLFPVQKPGDTFEVSAGAVDATEMMTIKATVALGLVPKGWRIKASARGGVLTGLALFGLWLVNGVLFFVTDAASVTVDIAGVFLFIAMLVAFMTAYRGYVLTDAGADQRDYLKGMRLYLTVAEQERMRILQSPTGAERVDYTDKREIVKLYEKLLPFAVLWGVENEWSKELALHYTDTSVTPDWWVGRSAFDSAIFAGSFSSITGAVSSSVAPISSGGGSGFGGSFGGGFSGGGGGGGGGGGR